MGLCRLSPPDQGEFSGRVLHTDEMRADHRITPLGTWMLLALAVSIVTASGIVIVASPSWSLVESHAIAVVGGVHSPILDMTAGAVAVLFGVQWAMVISVLVAVAIGFSQRSWRAGVRTLILIGAPCALVEILKVVIGRPRPEVRSLGDTSTFIPTTLSYPSGHTAFAAALATAVVLLAFGRIRPIIIAAAAVVVIITAWSRVYLAVHYPSDVLASIVLVPACVVALHRLTESFATARPLAPLHRQGT